MQSGHDFLYYAKKAVRENPEVFEALMEFERTKRVPKTTYRRRVDVTIDESILSKAKSFCDKSGMSFSRLVEKGLLQLVRAEP